MPLACERDLKPAITFTLKYFLYFSAARPSLTIMYRRERQNLDHRCNQVAIAPQSAQQILNTAIQDLQRTQPGCNNTAVQDFLADAGLREVEAESVHQMLLELQLPEPTLHEFIQRFRDQDRHAITEQLRRYRFTKLSELRLVKLVLGGDESLASETKTWSPFVPYCVLSVYNSV